MLAPIIITTTHVRLAKPTACYLAATLFAAGFTSAVWISYALITP